MRRRFPCCGSTGWCARSIRGRARSPCSTVPRPISGPGRRWRWSDPRAPASRRCCTSPACSRRPDGGHVIINGQDCTGMGDADRTRVRRVQMGFVYQFHQLLPEFSALENVVIPQMILGRSRRVAAQRAAQLLGALGLADRVESPPRATVGRRAAAHRHRPRAGQRSAPHPRRRADRQPRSAHRRARVRRAVASHPHHRRRRAHRHPQPGAGAPHGPRAAPGRRPAGRGRARLRALSRLSTLRRGIGASHGALGTPAAGGLTY